MSAMGKDWTGWDFYGSRGGGGVSVD